MLPPTSEALRRDTTKPYFLWWTDATVGDLRTHLASDDPAERAYWLGALVREANSRDVWLYVTPNDIRASWSAVARHLGRARAMWAWLLEIAEQWPPSIAHRTQTAVLSGLHLRHRLSRDIDLFFAESGALRDVVRVLPDIARSCSMTIDVVRDAGNHVRAVAAGDERFRKLATTP